MPVWLIQLLVGVFLSIASTLIDQAFKNDRNQIKQKPPGIRGSVQAGGGSPASFIMGTYGTAGHKEYPSSTWGNSGETPNAYLVDVISVSDLPITGINKVWLNSEVVTYTGTAATQGTPATGTYAGYSWRQFNDGTQTTVNSYLDSAFGAHPDRPWQSDMIGRGIAYVVMTALFERSLFNALPAYMFEVQGIKLYDPRKDTTAGGSGSQRLATPSTWAFSDNPAVMIYNILTGIKYDGAWFWGMQNGVPQARLPYANWAAAMDACDTLINLDGGGSEKQFRAGVEIDVDEAPIDVINKLLKACNGRMTEIAGTYKILVGAPAASVYSFSDADLLVSEPKSLDPFPGIENTINGVTASYVEPNEAWEIKECPPRYSSTLEASDDNRRLAASIRLDEVFSGTQAQRITKVYVEEARRFGKHVLPMPTAAQVLEPLDAADWTSGRNQYSAKDFLITSADEDESGNVIVGVQEQGPTDHSWTPGTDQLPYDVAPLAPSRPAAQPMSGWGVTGASLKDDDGIGRRPTLLISYAGPQVDVRAVQIQVGLKSSGDLVFDGEAPFEAPYSTLLNFGGFLPNTEYEVRGKYVPWSNRTTEWSSWVTGTTPNIRITSSDLANELNIIRTETTRAMQELNDYLYSLGNTVGSLDQSVKDEVVSKFGRAAALVVQEARARADADGALATSISAVVAQYDDISASALVSMQAVAAPSGWDARIAMIVKADGVTPAQALFYMDAKSSGESRIILAADLVGLIGEININDRLFISPNGSMSLVVVP